MSSSPINHDVSVYHYPIEDGTDPSRNFWDSKLIGEKLAPDAGDGIKKTTAAQAYKNQVIKSVAVLAFTSLAAFLLSSMAVAGTFALATAGGVWVIVRLKPDLENPEVRIKIILDLFKNRALEQFAEQFTLDDVFDFSLFSSQLSVPSPINYADYAMIATRYQKNKAKLANDKSDIVVKTTAEIESKKAEAESHSNYLAKFKRNQNDLRKFLEKRQHEPGFDIAYISFAGETHLQQEKARQRVEAQLAECHKTIKEWENTQQRQLKIVQESYNESLNQLADRFKNLIPEIKLPVALPINIQLAREEVAPQQMIEIVEDGVELGHMHIQASAPPLLQVV